MTRTVNMSTRCAGFACQFMRDRDATCSRRKLRSRVVGVACAGALLALCACAGKSTDDPVTEYSVVLEIGAAAPPPVSRALQPGSYLVELREDEIDLRMSVDAGQTHA